MSYTIALTGGVASGKSTVSEQLGVLGALVVDTDVLAREVVAANSPALAELVDSFGSAILTSDGALDRRAMRERVFADAEARRRLEGIVHPRIRDAALAAVAASQAPYVVLVVPLLYEHFDAYRWVDRVLVVDVLRATQKRRLLARDGIDNTLAEAMLDAQASREQRLSIADDVLENESDLASLATAVEAIHHQYLALAQMARKA
jgi:dephospho-CoA kinase